MSDCLEATSWAVTEFADADLGDLRRTQRLVQLAHALAQRPGAALPEACGSGAMLKAAYRFFTNDDIAPDDIVQSHIEATYSRLHAVPIVLAVQDTTEANWTNLRATEGLGPLGHPACHWPGWSIPRWPSRRSGSRWGSWPNRSGPGTRDDRGKRACRKQLPISQKESQKWLYSLDAVYTARDCCPTTHMISVGDLEAESGD